eukprot:g44032.t1
MDPKLTEERQLQLGQQHLSMSKLYWQMDHVLKFASWAISTDNSTALLLCKKLDVGHAPDAQHMTLSKAQQDCSIFFQLQRGLQSKVNTEELKNDIITTQQILMRQPHSASSWPPVSGQTRMQQSVQLVRPTAAMPNANGRYLQQMQVQLVRQGNIVQMQQQQQQLMGQMLLLPQMNGVQVHQPQGHTQGAAKPLTSGQQSATLYPQMPVQQPTAISKLPSPMQRQPLPFGPTVLLLQCSKHSNQTLLLTVDSSQMLDPSKFSPALLPVKMEWVSVCPFQQVKVNHFRSLTGDLTLFLGFGYKHVETKSRSRPLGPSRLALPIGIAMEEVTIRVDLSTICSPVYQLKMLVEQATSYPCVILPHRDGPANAHDLMQKQ